ncbi:MAG: polymer-forming cytoskeletal protein [Gammaproteobacteria bacterium]|nr:polymer-forming cytoskeletal protein [Gammaproteobacteria bacterium]
MFRKKAKEPSSTGFTLIANNCEVEGDVYFSGQLQVNGTIRGNIYAQDAEKARVDVSEYGQVTGDIKTPEAVINGKVCGDIHSEAHIELHEKAVIEGNVYYNLIEMVIGSQVDGNLVHVPPKAEAPGASNISPLGKPGAVHSGTGSTGEDSV